MSGPKPMRGPEAVSVGWPRGAEPRCPLRPLRGPYRPLHEGPAGARLGRGGGGGNEITAGPISVPPHWPYFAASGPAFIGGRASLARAGARLRLPMSFEGLKNARWAYLWP